MPNHDAVAIANEFIRRNGGPMNQMKLQKLVYLAHGWTLAIDKQPLVSDQAEAWDNGPVFRRLWDHLRDFGWGTYKGLTSPFDKDPIVSDLTDREGKIIDHVWKKYGGYSGLDLSKMTHREGTPWSNAYFGSGRNTALSQADIKNHFIELALAGRQ